MKHETENYTYTNKAYVTEYGDYATEGSVLTFEQNLLTISQWQLVDELPDSMKFEYVLAILDGEEDVVAEIESENR
jgi:hypothetical protein